MRRLAVLIAVPVLIVLASPSAFAAKPDREPIANYPLTLDPSLCGFFVHIGFPDQNEYATIWTHPDGTVVDHINGTLVAKVTNANTLASMTVNISGPAINVTHPDGSYDVKLRGPILIWGVIGPLPSLALVHGQIDLHGDSPFSQGVVTKLTGAVDDVCAELS